MNKLRRRRLHWLAGAFVLLAGVLLAGADAVHGDSPFEAGSDIRIEAATATPARRGEVSRIRFRIVNNSRAAFHVTGLDTPAGEASLGARLGTIERAVPDSLGVPAGETVDLTTSHLSYEFGPLTQELHAGETFDMTLSFVGGRFVVPVHVHAP
ncbi:MAG: hypothetical protein WD270_06855 [Acetobacterales bacterium]